MFETLNSYGFRLISFIQISTKPVLMKKLLLACFVATFLLSCGGTQKTTNYLQTGNYTDAFNNSVAQLTKNKSSSANQKHIPLLKEAFDKAAAQDLNEITALKGQKSPETLKKVYGKYLNLDLRQDEVRVLQPLYFEGQEMTFNFKDYTGDIQKAKDAYSGALYNLAMTEMKGGTEGARKAYKHLEELIYVNPTYKSNLDATLQKAKDQGSSFVLVKLINNTRTIAKDSLKGFTKINSGNFENQWVIFHDTYDRKVQYDHQVNINLDKLSFTPPETKQEKVPQEAKVQDGWQYQLDSNGNVMKDDKGNDIKVAKYVIARAEVYLYQQNKSSKLDGSVVIKNFATKQNTTNPVFGEAKFQHTYGKFKGDQRAIEQKYFEALKTKELAYPQDHEFVKYTILNFKQKVTAMLSQQQF